MFLEFYLRIQACVHKINKLTRVDLSVGTHSIGIHNVLEASGKLVGSNNGGGSVGGGNTVHKRGNRRTTFSLK